jgi:hypothetical protein
VKLAVAVVVLLAGSAHAEPGYELHVPDRIELHAGESGTLPISIDRGRAISKDAGLLLDLAPEGAVTLKRRRLGRADAVDPDADAPRFAIAVHADTAGDYAIKLHLRFWLCGAKVCRPVDARRTVAVAVAADAAPRQSPPDH